MKGEQKIKIIKIEVGEAPAGFYRQYLERVLHKPLRLSFTEGAEVNPNLEETFTKEVLPIQRYVYGKHWEEYYIRDEDKEKFEDLIKVYIKQAKLDTIKLLQNLLGERHTDVLNKDTVFEALLEVKRNIK